MDINRAYEKVETNESVVKAVKEYSNVMAQITMGGGVVAGDELNITRAEAGLVSALELAGIRLEPELSNAGFDNTLPAFVALFE